MQYYDIHTHHPPIHQDITAIVSVDVRNPVLPEMGVYSVGIHPRNTAWSATGYDSRLNQSVTMQSPLDESLPLHEDFFRLQEMAKLPNVVAIGETGLDKLAATPLDQQTAQFITHIELAEKYHKPLIIHCVKAWQELIAIRKQFTSPIPWIIHGFRGNGQLARQMLHSGFSLSFGLHFHPDALRTAWESHSLYAETDDLPISIKDVYHRIASLLPITHDALSLEIDENFLNWRVPLRTQLTTINS
ncbi:MAG: TatD family hydrolase [Tannerella sp.]|jgi:TatD DNase family protein|nr:TatD family hydrolase [Tannerella sp.]